MVRRTISIVIPCYNEASRAERYFREIDSYFKHNQELTAEIIAVDDGSSDTTARTLAELGSRLQTPVRVISYPKNRGKGYAVRCGVLNASGDCILIADADGATKISELERLLPQLNEKVKVVFGSRAVPRAGVTLQAQTHRKLIGRLFNFLVNSLLVSHVYDSQCGFKIYEAQVGKALFRNQVIDGFSFDVEVLYLCQQAGVSFKEVGVNWTNQEGSKVNIFVDSIKMAKDLLLVRFRKYNIEQLRSIIEPRVAKEECDVEK